MRPGFVWDLQMVVKSRWYNIGIGVVPASEQSQFLIGNLDAGPFRQFV